MKNLRSIQKFISKLCTPAHIYFILSIVSTLLYIYVMINAGEDESLNEPVHHYTFFGLIFKILWHLLFLLFIDYLCKKGHRTIAWVVLFLPFILIIFIALMLMFIFKFFTSNKTSLGKLNQSLNNYKSQVNNTQNNYRNDGRPSLAPIGVNIN